MSNLLTYFCIYLNIKLRKRRELFKVFFSLLVIVLTNKVFKKHKQRESIVIIKTVFAINYKKEDITIYYSL